MLKPYQKTIKFLTIAQLELMVPTFSRGELVINQAILAKLGAELVRKELCVRGRNSRLEAGQRAAFSSIRGTVSKSYKDRLFAVLREAIQKNESWPTPLMPQFPGTPLADMPSFSDVRLEITARYNKCLKDGRTSVRAMMHMIAVLTIQCEEESAALKKECPEFFKEEVEEALLYTNMVASTISGWTSHKFAT